MEVTRNDPSPIRIMIAVMQVMGAAHILLSRGSSHYPGYAKIACPSKQRKKVPSIRAEAQILRTFDVVFGLAFPRLP